MESQWTSAEGPLRVLLVEDSPADARLIQESLRQSSGGKNLQLRHVSLLAEAQAALGEQEYDCILLDLGLPDSQGVDNVTVLRQQSPATAIVVMTGLDDEQTARAALIAGAQEYAVKGLPVGELLIRLIWHAIERNRMLHELNQLREHEYFQATHDLLTSLPNRQLFSDRARQMAEQARRQGTQLAICYIDLDGFKPVNDIYGHPVGDMLLKAVAGELKQAVRSGDSVARIGGDEFAALLAPSSSGRLEAQQIAQRIIDRIQAITQIADYPVRIGASIGIAILPDHGDELDEVLQRADLAMYAAKSGGRGCYRFYSVELEGERDQRNRIAAEIEEALRLDRFFLHWQPWQDTQNNSIAGIEALPRWPGPQGDTRHLAQHASVAEQSGLMPKIMHHLLPKACRQWRQWQRDGMDAGYLAYPLGFRSLREAQVVNHLGRILLEQDVAPEQFQINLPGDSQTLVAGGQVLVQRVAELRGIGFRVMLDRFAGEGAVLGMIPELRASAVRVDPDLVNRLEGPLRQESLAQIARIVDTAGSFGIEVIASDVETRAQLKLLKQIGCRYMQGFLLGRPGDARHAEHLLQQGVRA